MARDRKPASGGKATLNRKRAIVPNHDESTTIDRRRSKKQMPKLHLHGSATAPKRSTKSTFQSQSDEHSSQEIQSEDDDDDDSNDDDDFVDANDHASHENDERDQDESEHSSGSEDKQYSESFLTKVQAFTSKATLAQATAKVTRLRNQLQQLASVEEQRDLNSQEERQRRRFNYELRLCNARCEELKRAESTNQETDQQGPPSDEEPEEEVSGAELEEQEPAEEPTAKASSGSTKTARTKRTSKKRDTSPAWVHDPKKWWPIHGIIQEHRKGEWYLVHWQGTDKQGKAWDNSWVRKEKVTDQAIREWEDQNNGKAGSKRGQAAKQARKKTKPRGKTSGRS